MTPNEIITLAIGSVALTGSLGAGGLYLADTRYVTQESMLIKEIRDLEREVNLIKKKEKYGIAKPYELDIKIDLETEIKDLQRQVGE